VAGFIEAGGRDRPMGQRREEGGRDIDGAVRSKMGAKN
jgi:hypothetical protein